MSQRNKNARLLTGGIVGAPSGTVGRRGVGVGPAYAIGHSLDFDGSNDYLSRTPSTDGNMDKWTWSGWVKRHVTGTSTRVFGAGSGTSAPYLHFSFSSTSGEVDTLRFDQVQSGGIVDIRVKSKQTFASTDTWYHVIVSYDSLNSTAANRLRWWVNGQSVDTDETNSRTYPSSGKNTLINDASYSMWLGRNHNDYGDLSLAEVHFLDGYALQETTPSITVYTFGETRDGQWVPKEVTGVTYGTNGFYLDFADNSTTAALGNDVSGNNNDFTVYNMTTGDQTTDVPAAAPDPTLRTRGRLGAAPAAINPVDHFNIVLWTGDGAGSKSVTGVNFQPEIMWLKSRTGPSRAWHLYDVLRGGFSNPQAFLASQTTEERDPQSDFGSGGVATIGADGFTLTSGTSSNNNLNESGKLNVGFCLKAGGAGVSNTDGSINSTVSANTEAGLSIVTFTQSSSPQTIGHGLSQAPELILVKDRDTASDWLVYHSATGAGEDLHLNEDHVATSSSVWNSTAPTSSVFSYNVNSGSTVAYCFHSVPGFSKVGSYTGDGGTSKSVALGFRPAFLMVKRTTDVASNWVILDNARDLTNPRQTHLYPNNTNVESTTSGLSVDFDDAGFTLLGNHASINASNGDYIFLAFAESHTLGPPGVLTLYDRYIDTLT